MAVPKPRISWRVSAVLRMTACAETWPAGFHVSGSAAVWRRSRKVLQTGHCDEGCANNTRAGERKNSGRGRGGLKKTAAGTHGHAYNSLRNADGLPEA